MAARFEKKNLWVLAIVLPMLLSLPLGCGGGGGGGGESGAFQVSFSSPATPFRFPAAGETGFGGNSVITVEFTDPVDPSTVMDPTSVNGLSTAVRFTNVVGARVSAQAFLGGVDAEGNPPQNTDLDFSSDGGNVLRIVADTDGNLATFESFGDPADLDTVQVTVVVGPSARSMGGSSLVRAFCATYLIGLSTPNPAPRVVSVFPPNDSTEIALAEEIEVTFSEEVDPLSVIGVVGDPSFPVNIRLGGVQVNMGGAVPIPSALLAGTIRQTFPGDNCTFTLTPAAALPGQSIINVNVVGAALVNPGAPGPSSPNGVRDMLGDAMAFTMQTRFQTRMGPVIANNPVPPYAIYFGALNPNRFGVIAINAIEDQLGNQTNFLGIDSDGDQIANPGEDLIVFPNSENTESIGRVSDMLIGDVITLASVPNNGDCVPPPPIGPVFLRGNSIDNPPVPNPPPVPAINSTTNCVPSLCMALGSLMPSIRPTFSNAELGNHVYVADDVNDVIHVINSVTSLPMAQIPTPDPTGLASDPDMNFLYCTNRSANTMSVIDIRRDSPTQFQVIREVAVGLGPRSITVQPDNEDILVCDQSGGTITIINASSFVVRKTLATLVGPTPWDIASTYRGSTGTYFAFITNLDGNNVSIFESGPSTPLFFGPDDVVAVISEGPVAPFERPMGVTSNRSLRLGVPVFDAPGCLFVCNGNRSLAEIQLTAFQGPPLPNFPSPGELRTFEVVLQTNPLDPQNPVGVGPTDVALNDNVSACTYLTTANTKAWHRFQPPNPNLLNECNSVLIANQASGTVSVVNRRNGLLIDTIDVPGVNLLKGFFE